MLDPAQLTAGDRLYDTRRKVDATVIKVAPCGGCACGHGDISVREDRSQAWLPHHLPPAA